MNPLPSRGSFDVLVVGGSAGAIEALSTIVPSLPSDLPAAVLVVLHLHRERESLLPAIFAPRCALKVSEAIDKLPLANGAMLFAPPDYHMLVDEGRRIALSDDEPVQHSRPSIDVLFESAADAFGARVVALLLSGSNDDGARGAEAVASAGGCVIVQDPATALAPRMSEAAIERVPSARVLTLEAIATSFASWTVARSAEKYR